MKLLDPSFGLYSLRTGAWVVAFTHCLIGFHVMAKFIDTHVIPVGGEMNGLEIFFIILFLLGLIFNFALQIILLRGVMTENLTVCQYWLALGPSGGAFWISIVYYMSPCISCGGIVPLALSTKCIVLSVVGFTYHFYVWYVIFSYTVSLRKPILGEPVPSEVNVNVNPINPRQTESGLTVDNSIWTRFRYSLHSNVNSDPPPPRMLLKQ